jgi:hypothetical protein
MNRSWFKPFSFAVVALSLVTASCDSLPTDNPLAPESSAPSQNTSFAPAMVPAQAVHSGTTYTFVTANPDNNTLLSLLQLIGPLGGILQVNKHTLNVPLGAVLVPTLFGMEVERNGYVQVELHAYLQGLLGLLDIGGKGFLKPVTLSLSYANATNVTDPSHLHIALLNADGTINSILPTTIDTRKKTASAKLPHFSSYVLICD